MKYDWDTPVERIGTDCFKWDWNRREGDLPMWVADMDFKAAPAITEEIRKRAEHGVFGYTMVPESWYSAYLDWWRDRHGYAMEKEWIMYVSGVIPAISSTIRALTAPGRKVIVQTPVYNAFFSCITNNGCQIAENQLIYENGGYRMDLDDLEEKASDPGTDIMILCNPHNPAGKIWDKETLVKVGEICARNNVTVISDEVHCDIVTPGSSYTPFAAASETCRGISVMVMAATKAFNIAGINSACISVADKALNKKIRFAADRDEIAHFSIFSGVAATAFRECGDWLDEMCEYVSQNRKYAAEFIKNELPELHLIDGDATYLLWLDISSLGVSSKALANHLRNTTGLFVTPGSQYGKGGEGFLRINAGCPRLLVQDGLNRLKTGIRLRSEP
ncbi:MAG: pyridoxal phosphate-dependent aminotransferase [Saccharofermentans sp.]|nr:pyridoxal phosphate-dependent aminotransferase [Saccharofermentans sp.]